MYNNSITSQVNSLVQSIRGDNTEARQIQYEFGKSAESIVDSIPVVGHVKGAIHVLAGDEETGLKILEGKLNYNFT